MCSYELATQLRAGVTELPCRLTRVRCCVDRTADYKPVRACAEGLRRREGPLLVIRFVGRPADAWRHELDVRKRLLQDRNFKGGTDQPPYPGLGGQRGQSLDLLADSIGNPCLA